MTPCIDLVKEDFFLIHIGSFFHDFLLQTQQLTKVTVAISYLSLFEILDEQNLMHFPKYVFDCFGKGPWAANCRFDFRRVVVNLDFVHFYIAMLKVRAVSLKHISE